MNEQQQLMALMVLAEKQQAAVQAAIEGLKEQQKALEKATEGVQRAASSGAAAAVGQTMSNASKIATEAFNAATTTTLGKLRAAATDADEAQDRLSRATLTFGFKWVGVAVVTLAACLILFSAVAFFLVGWKEYQVKNLTDQRAELIEEVDKLKITINRRRLSSKSLDQSARKVVQRHITKEQFDDLPEGIKSIIDPSRISPYEGKGVKGQTRKRKTQRKGNKKSRRK